MVEQKTYELTELEKYKKRIDMTKKVLDIFIVVSIFLFIVVFATLVNFNKLITENASIPVVSVNETNSMVCTVQTETLVYSGDCDVAENLLGLQRAQELFEENVVEVCQSLIGNQ